MRKIGWVEIWARGRDVVLCGWGNSQIWENCYYLCELTKLRDQFPNNSNKNTMFFSKTKKMRIIWGAAVVLVCSQKKIPRKLKIIREKGTLGNFSFSCKSE